MLSYSERCFLNVNVIILLLWWKSIGGFPGPSVRIRAITVTLVPNALWVGSIPPPTLHPFTYFSRDQLPRRTSGPPNKVSCFMPWEPLRMKLLPLPGCPCPSLRPPPPPRCPKSAWQTPAYPSGISFRPLLQLLLGVLSPPSPR